MAVVSNGTTLIDNGALDAAVPTGNLILLSTQTASASASISFTSDIDSTYDSYVFKFINIHPATNSTKFQFNLSTDGGSNYNVTKTTTWFAASHYEDNSSAQLAYSTSNHLTQSTSDQPIGHNIGNGNDESYSGTLQLFNPSSTTYYKHFIVKGNSYAHDDSSFNVYVAGYGSTTSAVDAVRFQQSSGNIDSGTIKLYGVK